MHIHHFYSRETIKCQSSHKSVVDSSTFINCVSSGNGGAILCSSSKQLDIISCLFYYCSGSYGGAIYSSTNTKISCSSIILCEAENNSPSYYINGNAECFLNTITQCDGYDATISYKSNTCFMSYFNLSNSKIMHQVACIIARIEEEFVQKYTTFTNCSDVGGCSLTYYIGEFNIEFLNAINITSNNGFSFLFFGYGSIVEMSNCVFKHSKHPAIAGFNQLTGTERIHFRHCLFDSPYTSINEKVTCENISFVSNPKYHGYKYDITCVNPFYTNSFYNKRCSTGSKLYVFIILLI